MKQSLKMIRKNIFIVLFDDALFFFYREHREIRKSKLPWKQRNSIDKLKMIRPSEEGNEEDENLIKD